jgi:choline dehydrogenase-like flavoprotein
VVTRNGRAVAVELQDRASGAVETVSARVIVVAADTFRTPQLLWASGIRHHAVGRYLTDHLMTKATIELHGDMVEECRRNKGPLGRSVTSVNFADGSHPFHGTILQGLVNLVPGSWVRIAEGGAVPETMTSMTWLSRTTPQQLNGVTFDDTEKDWAGMPKMAVEFELTASDKAERERAIELVRVIGEGLGEFLPGREPSTLAPGRSYHFTGTVRMGATDDGASVCDRYGRVWGFDNLFVAGNGLIPTATTVNPTLTSVALAAIGSGEIVKRLG